MSDCFWCIVWPRKMMGLGEEDDGADVCRRVGEEERERQ